MSPWNWYWPFQIHFPLGGNIAQNIEPNFGQIKASAGDAQLEAKISNDVHSYGRQLGKITALLLAISESEKFSENEKVQGAKAELEKLSDDIAKAKAEYYQTIAKNIKGTLEKIRAANPEAYAALIKDLKNL